MTFTDDFSFLLNVNCNHINTNLAKPCIFESFHWQHPLIKPLTISIQLAIGNALKVMQYMDKKGSSQFEEEMKPVIGRVGAFILDLCTLCHNEAEKNKLKKGMFLS